MAAKPPRRIRAPTFGTPTAVWHRRCGYAVGAGERGQILLVLFPTGDGLIASMLADNNSVHLV